MGRMKKKLISLMVLSLLMTPTNTMAQLQFNNVGVIEEEANKDKIWHTIPSKWGTYDLDCLSTKVTKTYYNDKGNKVVESGDVSIWIKSYAYIEDTTRAIKIGTTLTYLNAETNKYVTEWWEAKETYSEEEIGWPNISDVYVELAKEMKFESTKSRNQIISMDLKTNKGEAVTFKTTYPVAFQEKKKNPSEMNTLTFTTMNGGEVVVDEYLSKLDKNSPYGNSKVFNPPLEILPDSFINLNLSLHSNKDGEVPKYQIVSGDTEPELPYTDGVWQPIGTSSSETETQVQYKDMIDTPSLLTVQHYIYTPGYTESPKEYGYGVERDRFAVFSSPVNKTVLQSTVLKDNKKYSTQAGDPVFFRNSMISNKTTLEAVFIPKETGEYKFTVLSATGSKGIIKVDDKEITFIDNFGIHIKDDERYYGLDTPIKLEKGKRYTLYMETRHASPYDKAPCFMYSMKPIEGWPEDYYINEIQEYNDKYKDSWRIVTPELLQEQNPSNGSNRAMKIWGFIVPDESGEFNFGLQADDGAYGYLMIDNQKKVFVDSFGINKIADKSNNLVLDIKKDVPYPLYIEWYEGSPFEQALAPRYRDANKGYADNEGWKDIPAHWFRPSSSTDIVNNPWTTYYGVEADKRIDLPYNDKMNYVIIQVEDEDGRQHQVKYGPFTGIKGNEVEFESPCVNSDKNYIVPTSVSNINTTIAYNMDSKAISYELDLTALKSEKLNGNVLFKPGLRLSDINVKLEEGTMEETGRLSNLVSLNSSDYKVSVAGEKIVIELTDKERVVKKGTGHKMTVYFKVNLNDNILYYDKDNIAWYYTTYKDNKISDEGVELSDVVVKITANKKYKMVEEVYNPITNTIVKPALYSTDISETVSKIGLDLREIPGIS